MEWHFVPKQKGRTEYVQGHIFSTLNSSPLPRLPSASTGNIAMQSMTTLFASFLKVQFLRFI